LQKNGRTLSKTKEKRKRNLAKLLVKHVDGEMGPFGGFLK